MSEPRTWREPYEETVDIYPGLCVHDGRVAGSITLGRSRLPLWAIIRDVTCDGWNATAQRWETSRESDWTEDDAAEFLHCLLEARGEFARLLLTLANVERAEGDDPWYWHEYARKAVIAQLRRCIDVLDPVEVDPR